MRVRFRFVPLMLLAVLSAGAGQAAAETPERVRAVEQRLMKMAAEKTQKYRKSDVELVFRGKDGAPLRGANVSIRQKNSDFLVGCIIFPLVRGGEPHRPELFKERFSELFNFAVFPFYWAGYEPRQGKTVWARLEPVLDWCRANGIVTKGHPLIWNAPSGKPGWLARYGTEQQLRLLQSRVINVVGGYAGRIEMWDVFNEPVNIRAWDDTVSSVWTPSPVEVNIDLVERAFHWAHLANPEADLILNDFYQIAKEDTRKRFIDFVRELQRREAPISGVGIQAHEPRQEWYPPEETWETLQQIGDLGLPMHITEFTPRSDSVEVTGGWRDGVWTRELQADFAEQMLRLAFAHPSVRSFNFWGFSDRHVWLPGGGLVNEHYRPKPVYDRLKKILHEEWRTSVDLETDSSGVVRFNGFHGGYEVTVRGPEGKVEKLELRVRRNEANRREFTLESF